jgi:hypothetical protein
MTDPVPGRHIYVDILLRLISGLSSFFQTGVLFTFQSADLYDTINLNLLKMVCCFLMH